MKARRILATTLFMLFTSIDAYAEIYRGIMPLSTLADIREQFPGAAFTETEAAWAQENEVLYELSGPGLPGKVMIKLSDMSAFWKSYIQDNPKEDTEENRALATPNKERMSVDWVRYIPDSPVPISRLISKYGQPESNGFSEDDFGPYSEWPSKGVYVRLADDAKTVMSIDYSFTLGEHCSALKMRNGFDAPGCEKKKALTPAKGKTKKSK